jgi:hypothetical protein
MSEKYDYYALIVSREDINFLFEQFEKIGLAKAIVEESGEISFSLKEESRIKLTPMNIVYELTELVKEYDAILSDDSSALNDKMKNFLQAKKDAVLLTTDIIRLIYDKLERDSE